LSLWVKLQNSLYRPFGTVGAVIEPEWTQLRGQREYSHAARAVLTVAGFGALVISVLMETPLTPRRTFPGNLGFFSKGRLCRGAGRMAQLRNR
jgi:hypothetical protein